MSSTRAQVLLSSSSDSGLLLPESYRAGQTKQAARYFQVNVRTGAALVKEDDPIDVRVETSRATSAKQYVSLQVLGHASLRLLTDCTDSVSSVPPPGLWTTQSLVSGASPQRTCARASGTGRDAPSVNEDDGLAILFAVLSDPDLVPAQRRQDREDSASECRHQSTERDIIGRPR